MKGARLIANQYLQKHWDSRALFMHQRRMRSIKGSNYRASPVRYGHIKSDKKKERQLEDRVTEIERENRILVERMHKIIEPRSRSLSKMRPSFRKESLNRESRRRELVRITEANHALYQRLKASHSTIGQVRENSVYKKKRSRSSWGRAFEIVKKILYLEGRQMQCEIDNSSSGLLITLLDTKKPEKYQLSLNREETQELFSKYRNVESIFDMISLEDNQLMLNIN